MNSELQQLLTHIIRESDLTVLFQPIYCTETAQVYGYEALVRGPSDSPLHSPLQLFHYAMHFNLLSELELVCRKASIQRFVELGLPGKLFLNVSPMVFLNDDHPQGVTLSYLKEFGVDSDRVVIELSEKYPIDQPELLVSALKHYRELGLNIAVDDLGAGYSGLKLWSEVKPNYVKIDRYFINEIQHDPIKREFVRSIFALGQNINAKIVAEGLETDEEFSELKELGLTLAQGYLLARPTAYPTTEVPAKLNQEKRKQRYAIHLETKVSSLIQNAKSVHHDEITRDVVAYLHKHPHIHSIPVLKAGTPVGMVLRGQLLELFSTPYGRSLHEKKAIENVMMKNPVTVEASAGLDEVANLVTSAHDEQLLWHFIVTDKGRYAGIGSVRDLLRRITTQQLQHASYANPLTLLPGNVPIDKEIDRLLQEKKSFHVAYFDLNHFKPFNDVYGYAKGDEVIKLVAELLNQCCNNHDFIGHVGGDDFVVLYRTDDWLTQTRNVLNLFEARIPNFYDREDQLRGGIFAKDRSGISRLMPLLGLAVGIVEPDVSRCHSHHDVARLASDAKKQAKQQSDSCIFVSRRRGPDDLHELSTQKLAV